MHHTDKRKARRQPIRYTAWIVTGPDSRHGCVLSDISDHGARLDVEDGAALPDTFMLWLSARGRPRRVCRVVWRNEKQVGVEFEKQLLKVESASLAPAIQAHAASDEEPAETV